MADEIEETEPSEAMPDELWLDPLMVINTLTDSIYHLADCDLPEQDMKAIISDFTAVMYQCTKLIKATIKEQLKLNVK